MICPKCFTKMKHVLSSSRKKNIEYFICKNCMYRTKSRAIKDKYIDLALKKNGKEKFRFRSNTK